MSATPRTQLLKDAIVLVSDDRNSVYGPPSHHHTKTAAMWTVLFGHQFTAADVCKAFICDKLVRLSVTPDHRDSAVDIAGYAACLWEDQVETQ
jgi:hypothetical protein